MTGIPIPSDWSNAMETANIENEVKRLFEEIQARNICVHEFNSETAPPPLDLRQCNCLWGKINTDDLKAMLGEVKRIGARSATEVKRAAGFSLPALDERNDLGRSNARIPGWSPKPVHEIVEKPLQHRHPA